LLDEAESDAIAEAVATRYVHGEVEGTRLLEGAGVGGGDTSRVSGGASGCGGGIRAGMARAEGGV